MAFTWKRANPAALLRLLLSHRQLTGLAAAQREAKTVGDVVQTGLQLLQQQLASDAGLVRSLLVVSAELCLECEVDTLRLLFLAQLKTVSNDLLLLLGLAVLARGEVALLNGALFREALGSLEKKFGAVATAETTYGSCVTCHDFLIS